MNEQIFIIAIPKEKQPSAHFIEFLLKEHYEGATVFKLERSKEDEI